MKAERCPVCHGSGKYPALSDNSIFKPVNEKPIKQEDQKQCHGCQGKGWIALPEDHHTPIFFPTDKLRRQLPKKEFYFESKAKEYARI